MAVAFANMFMAKIQTRILRKTVRKRTVWKRYIVEIFSLWVSRKQTLKKINEEANLHHPTIKLTPKMKLRDQPILDIKTHFQPTTIQ